MYSRAASAEGKLREITDAKRYVRGDIGIEGVRGAANVEAIGVRVIRERLELIFCRVVERGKSNVCLSSSEPAIHKEVRNCSFYFFCFLGGVTGLLAPRPPP